MCRVNRTLPSSVADKWYYTAEHWLHRNPPSLILYLSSPTFSRFSCQGFVSFIWPWLWISHFSLLVLQKLQQENSVVPSGNSVTRLQILFFKKCTMFILSISLLSSFEGLILRCYCIKLQLNNRYWRSYLCVMKVFPLFTQRRPMGMSQPDNGRHRGSATFRSTTRSSSSSTATPAKSSDHPERLTAASVTTASVRSLCWWAASCCNVQRNLYKVSRQLSEAGLLCYAQKKGEQRCETNSLPMWRLLL